MTTIAYRNGIMAGDSSFTFNGIVDTLSRKVFRLKSGALLGQAGDNDGRPLLDLLEGVRTARQLPARADILALRINFLGLLVLPSRSARLSGFAGEAARGTMFKINSALKPPEQWSDANDGQDIGIWPIEAPFAAIGSGAELALGAMAQGATAIQAVKIACRFDIHSRPPVHAEASSPGHRYV